MDIKGRISFEEMDDHSVKVEIAGLGTVLVFIDSGEPGDPDEGIKVVIDPVSPDVRVTVDQ